MKVNRTKAGEWEQKVLDIRRVARVVAGGKRFSFRATVVIGNRSGKVGVGVAKGKDVAQAVEKATNQAKKDIIEVPIVEGTIPHEVYAKHSSAEVLIKPAKRGKGIIAGGAARAVLTLAGIKDVSAKILGRTPNKLTNARATLEALRKLKKIK
ncbi:MAG: 30S ribosomal protein S5 [Candidatus Paceibacteria bacterium]